MKDAESIVGGLTQTSKMPCPSYNLPASACKTGSLLAKQPGTVCSMCYARKGRYVFPNVKNALARRLKSLDNPLWLGAMIQLIQHGHRGRPLPYFRWHDSGDLQGVKHLHQIMEIAVVCKQTMFWLPTKEVSLVREFFRKHTCPENLIVRFSSAVIDSNPQLLPGELGACTHKEALPDGAAECPAYKTDGKCGDCRLCWHAGTRVVSYRLH